MHLSIIIPAYNEEKRIAASLDKIYAYFEPRNITYEVILVDDGSTDDTVLVSSKSVLASSGKLKLISNPKKPW